MQDLFLALDTLTDKVAGEPLNRPSALRVARRALLARIDPGMDRLARLSFLEGVAVGNLGVHIQPGKWMMKGDRGFKDAAQYFKNLNPAWTSKSNQGFFDAAMSGVESVLGKGERGNAQATRMFGSDIDAIVSDHMQGVQSYSGNRVKPVFYEVGLTLLSPNEIEGLQDGTTTPATAGIKGAIRGKFASRAKTLLNMYKTREKGLGKRIDPTTTEGRPTPGLEGEGLVTNPLYLELRKPSSPLANELRKILKEMAKATGAVRAEIYSAYLDFIKGGAFGSTGGGSILPRGWALEVGKAVGKSENQVRDAVKYVDKWLVENANSHRLWDKLRKLAEHIGAIGQLGLSSRMAKQASDDMISEWLAAELDACDCEDEDEDEPEDEILGVNKEVGGPPMSFTVGDVPGAAGGGYRFSAEAVAARWVEKSADGSIYDQLKAPLERDGTVYIDFDGEPTHFTLRMGQVPMQAVESWLKRDLGSFKLTPSRGRSRDKAMFTISFKSPLRQNKGEQVESPLEISLKLKRA